MSCQVRVGIFHQHLERRYYVNEPLSVRPSVRTQEYYLRVVVWRVCINYTPLNGFVVLCDRGMLMERVLLVVSRFGVVIMGSCTDDGK